MVAKSTNPKKTINSAAKSSSKAKTSTNAKTVSKSKKSSKNLNSEAKKPSTKEASKQVKFSTSKLTSKATESSRVTSSVNKKSTKDSSKNPKIVQDMVKSQELKKEQTKKLGKTFNSPINIKLVSFGVALLLILIIVTIGGWLWWAASPAESMNRMYSAIEKKDYEEAKKYIDPESIGDRIIDQTRELGNEITDEQAGQYKETLTEDIKRAINEGNFMFAEPTDIEVYESGKVKAKIQIIQNGEKLTGYFEREGLNWVFVGYDLFSE